MAERVYPLTPFYSHGGITILNGHVLEVLAGMEVESVHMCCTSPPYWGLRDYRLEPGVWDGPLKIASDLECRHEWGEDEQGGLIHENRNFKRGTNEEVEGTGPLVKVGEDRKMEPR